MSHDWDIHFTVKGMVLNIILIYSKNKKIIGVAKGHCRAFSKAVDAFVDVQAFTKVTFSKLYNQ